LQLLLLSIYNLAKIALTKMLLFMINNTIQKKRFEKIFFQSQWVNWKVFEILEFQS